MQRMHLQLVELGGGSGALTKSMLHTWRRTDKRLSRLRQIRIVEARCVTLPSYFHRLLCSEQLALTQQRTLCGTSANATHGDKTTLHKLHSIIVPSGKQSNTIDVKWYHGPSECCIDTENRVFTLFVANEFLDALPVHQVL